MTLSFDDATTRLLKSIDTAAPVTSPRISLTVVEGPDAGKRFEIEDLAHRQLSIGKSEACEIRLTDPTASRRHVAMELEDRGVILRDLGSSNGTFVDGLLIREAILRGGETIKIGTTSMKLELGSERHAVPTSTETSFGLFIGASPAIRRLYPRLDALAQIDVPLLIEGEAGTGKELLAEAIHERGSRKGGPYCVFDRGTIPPAEAEAMLFGRDLVEGETGPSGPGLLEQARGGTLFIDEIADLETPLQLKLARALEKRSIRRIGGTESIAVDVRCIAATRRDLDREVTGRRFREELLQLFAAARIELPPLRRRRGDIALLTRLFWAKFGGDAAKVPPEVIQRFEEHAWPGNVRELANAVAKELMPDDVSAPPQKSPELSNDFIDVVVREGMTITQARQKVMVELDRRYVRHILDQNGGNIAKAAAAAGITRRYFYTLRAK